MKSQYNCLIHSVNPTKIIGTYKLRHCLGTGLSKPMDFREELAAKLKAHNKKFDTPSEAKSTNTDTPPAPVESVSPIVNQEKKWSKLSIFNNYLAPMSPGNTVVYKKDCNF